MQTLMGIVTGIVADDHLHDLEIQMLSTWLSAHEAVTRAWPGAAIAGWVRDVCADGVVTDSERAHLLENLAAMVAADFSLTGSVQPEPTQLPVDDSAPIDFSGLGLVYTGTFAYGTRARCERLGEMLGARSLKAVTRATDMLVIGTQVTASWRTESYGQKIIDAMGLQQSGHRIRIVSERHWFESARLLGASDA